MATDTLLLPPRRFPPTPVGPRLDWLVLADAFELACLTRCSAAPLTDVGPWRQSEGYRTGMIEFNQEPAAERMKHLLARLDIAVAHEVTTGGLRRRYQLHRLYVPRTDRVAYAAAVETGWRQGRQELLTPSTGGTSAARRVWRPRLAAAAWRAALLGAGRHVRKHILGVRLNDQDLAAVLVRGATVLEVPATLVPGAGCTVVSVRNGADAERIMQHAAPPSPLSLGH
ncbi:hypothetical protein V6U90_31130 [Micromonospora sp. CPCC 206060]|uniref:hypothetical protein n=1 Tax=Micromonospora sp. CPCC 206060 TaxID=3122406 RepID=UPI002FF19AA0